MPQITPEMIERFDEMSKSENSDTAAIGKLFMGWITKGEKSKCSK